MHRFSICWAAALALAVLGCGEVRETSTPPPTEPSEQSTALSSETAEQVDARSVRAAYVALRQMEGAEDADYHARDARSVPGRASPGVSLVAANPQHQFWTEFGADRVGVVSSNGEFDVGLETRFVRCDGEPLAVTGSEPAAGPQKNRVAALRSAGGSPFEEWYLNGPLGLEQGFTFTSSPCGRGAAELALDVRVEGRTPLAASDGGAVILAKDGPVPPDLRITDLFAKDATGRVLPARFETEGDRLAIRVDIQAAVWPVEIDPIVATYESKLRTGGPLHGSINDDFGRSVSVSGTDAIVGAPGDFVTASGQGSAYVFSLTGGEWRLSGWLVAADPGSGDGFGSAVDIEGDYAAVAAPKDDVSVTDQGSAYVFLRTAGAWAQQQKLVHSDPVASDQLGTSLALSGASVVLGAPSKTVDAETAQGAAYVFLRSSTTWSQQAKLTEPVADGYFNDRFGASVAIQGDYAVIGAEYGPSASLISPGAAYVFLRSGTAWSLQQRLNATGGATNDRFGASVALDGAYAIVGAPARLVGANANQGSAYVFLRSGTVWAQQAAIVAADGAAQDSFGSSVSISGTSALIGSPLDDGTQTNQGSAYVFLRSTTVWSFQDKLTTPFVSGLLPGAEDRAGISVSISGDVAFFGAPLADYDQVNIGVVAVYTRTAAKWDFGKILTADDDAKKAGQSVAISGDTAILGAPAENVGANAGQGAAYVFLRTGTAWAKQARLLAADGAATDAFGSAVAISGNTALVGASSATVGANADQGAAYAFLRSGANWTQQGKLVATDGAAGDAFGSAVSLETDTAVVGAPESDPSAAVAAGAAYAFLRTGSVWAQQGKLVAADGAAGNKLGTSVGLSGNTAIAGAPLADVSGMADRGAAYVFSRSGTAWAQQQKLTANDGVAGDQFGDSCAVDGQSAVVGAVKGNSALNDTGAAYVFLRSGTTWAQQQKLTTTSAANDAFGDSVAILGETIVVGAPNHLNGGKLRGTGFVFVRSNATWSERAILDVPTSGTGNFDDHVGASVGLSGDTVVLGAPDDDFNAHTDHGSAHVFRLKGLAGQACALSTDCDVNYFCTDSVCCTSACPGPCEVCSAALGAISSGSCSVKAAGAAPDAPCPGGVLCNGISGSCPGGCTGDADCPANKYCSAAGTCLDWKPNGAACNPAADCISPTCHECASNFCVDGVCCNSACSGGPCDSCNGASPGTCAVTPKNGAPQSSCNGYLCNGSVATCPVSCTLSSDCESGYFCDSGSCLPKKAKGDPCTSTAQCGANLTCSDGVCCGSACLGKCQACSAANKEDGTASGDCGAAKKGSNPGNLCVKSTTDACGDQASCSGTEGVCALAPFGTACGPTSCNGSSVSGKVCDGTGTCIDQTNANCFPYVCQAGACTSPCTLDAQCDSQYFCTAGFCVPKKDNGLGCTISNECKSSFCVDKVCCDSPCTGQCEACATSGKVGQCLPVLGAPVQPRPDCSGTGACKGSCDGANPNACALPGSGKQCQPASCAGDVSTPAGTCDGAGACTTFPTNNCLPYGCDTATGVCKVSCAGDADCSQGSKCDTSSGKCAVATASCKDAFTVALPSGQTQSCVPYKCVGGACQQQCSASGDCAPGYDCQANSCVAVEGGSGGSAGSGGGAGAAGTGAASGTGGAGRSTGGAGGSSTGGSAGKSGGAGGETDAGAGTGGSEPAPSGDDGGCGCRAPGRGGRSGGALLLALGLALARLRRRALAR